MNVKKKIITGITMGDPSGIGPEIILKSFINPFIRKSRVVIIGDFGIMTAACDMLEIKAYRLNRILKITDCIFDPEVLNVLALDIISPADFKPGVVTAASGEAAFQCLRKAVDLIKMKEIDAVVTAPLNKEALHLAGHDYPGHTEILAAMTGTRDYAMLLYDTKLSVIHVSTHVSLMDAVRSLSRERIEKVIELANISMKQLRGYQPRIAVAGINPHAGENGLFGKEELNEIIPAVRNMQKKGLNVTGPLPPDTVFLQALKGKYDIVVAMYHDQGHIPLKLLGFSTGVNITAGLPFIRTSVDHGTAFEIAWKGIADEKSMIKAIRLSLKLSH